MVTSRTKATRIQRLFAIAILFAAELLLFQGASAQPGGSWSTKAPMPTKRCGMGAVALSGKIYLISGDTSLNVLSSSVQRYDPTSDSWTTMTSVPTVRYGMEAVAFEGKIYTFGGQTCAGSCFTGVVEAYDPSTNAWSTFTPMPTPRNGFGVVTLAGKIYTIGGYQEGHSPEVMNIVEIYDPATDTWTQGVPMHVTRCGFSCVVFNGKIYAFSGLDGTGGGTTTCEMFDPVTNVWTFVSSIPIDRDWYACDTLRGRACIVGGFSGWGAPDDSAFWVYDPNTNAWTAAEPMPTARHACAGIAVGGKLHVFGGNTDVHVGTLFDRDEVYSLDQCDSLIVPSVAVFPCDKAGFIQPVQVVASQPLSAVNVPLKIPAGVTIDSISRVGTATQGWPQFNDTIKTDSGFFQALASAGNGTLLPVGTSTVFNIFCQATQQCGTSQFIHWDTALSGNQSRQLQFSNSQFITIYPGFDRLKDSSEIKGYKVGDLNNSGVVDLSDLSTMVAYLTGNNPTICIMSSMDVTRNGIVDLSDLSMLVAYLTGVPGVHLDCEAPGPRLAVPDPNDEIALSTAYDNGQTLIAISTSIDLRAVQLVLKGYEGVPINSQLGQLDLLKGDHQGTLTAILIDLKGKNLIEKGKTQLLEIPGNCEVVSASVSDMDFMTRTPTINGASKLNDLPTSFSLEQNYPNPFNPTTTISFSLPTTTNYTLTIYNVAGQVVKEFSGAAGPGTIHQVWDAARNASGVYFYRLTAGDFTQNKKMMLLK